MTDTSVQKFLNSSISFYVTIIGCIFTIAGFYFGLSNRIDLLSQKLDYVVMDNTEVKTRISLIEKINNDLDKRLSALEIKFNK